MKQKFNPFESHDKDLKIQNEKELNRAKEMAGVVNSQEHLERLLASSDKKLIQAGLEQINKQLQEKDSSINGLAQQISTLEKNNTQLEKAIEDDKISRKGVAKRKNIWLNFERKMGKKDQQIINQTIRIRAMAETVEAALGVSQIKDIEVNEEKIMEKLSQVEDDLGILNQELVENKISTDELEVARYLRGSGDSLPVRNKDSKEVVDLIQLYDKKTN